MQWQGECHDHLRGWSHWGGNGPKREGTRRHLGGSAGALEGGEGGNNATWVVYKRIRVYSVANWQGNVVGRGRGRAQLPFPTPANKGVLNKIELTL